MASTKESPLQAQFDAAAEMLDADAATAYRSVINSDLSSEEDLRVKEAAVYKLADALTKLGNATALASLLSELRSFFTVVAKAKTAKIVRHVIDQVGKIPGTADIQVALCSESIEWCKAEKRSFLRMRLELRLGSLLLQQGKYTNALSMVQALLREVKKIDDKQMLVEVHLLESRIHYALRNVPKARAALTASRTAATSLYIGPELQAEIDGTAGTLHAEENDYRTAYSYFFEAFEGLHSMGDTINAVLPLKYMLLSKIMLGLTDDVAVIVNGKSGIKYNGKTTEGMLAIAAATKARSLHNFERALGEYSEQITSDPFMERHLKHLADTLLEQNLIRLIEPFSCVEISHVADLIGLPVARVESKLSGMILDRKFHGTLDQGRGQLLVFDRPAEDKAYAASLKVVENMHEAVDVLFRRAEKLK